MNPSKKIDIIEYRDGSFSETSDTVASEKRVKIFSDNREVLSLLCTPSMIRELVVGFAITERLLEDKSSREPSKEWCSERIEIIWKDKEIKVHLPLNIPEGAATLTSGCGKGITFQSNESEEKLPVIQDETSVSVQAIIDLYREFQKRSELFKATGGVHSAALCDNKEIIVFTEDIGRHNAVDKLIGYAFLENIPLKGKIMLLSGRLSSEITLKALRANVPILVSRAAPTDYSIEVADSSNITLIGFLRGQHMNIYTHSERITK